LKQGGAKVPAADGQQAGIPQQVQDLLIPILWNLEHLEAVTIVSERDEPLSTQRAADLLDISRRFLVQLLENGAIPFHEAGSHRRLYVRDVLDYKRRRDAARQ
jgi:excisionase family DNA binding protein